MGPVRQNPIQRTISLFICVCIALCTIVAHNIAQNRPDSFPPYPPENHHCSDDVDLREGGTIYKNYDTEKSEELYQTAISKIRTLFRQPDDVTRSTRWTFADNVNSAHLELIRLWRTEAGHGVRRRRRRNVTDVTLPCWTCLGTRWSWLYHMEHMAFQCCTLSRAYFRIPATDSQCKRSKTPFLRDWWSITDWSS